MADFIYTIHGPMWQFECEDCQAMGDCWDTEEQALAEMEKHDCFEFYTNRIPRHILKRLIEQHGGSFDE